MKRQTFGSLGCDLNLALFGHITRCYNSDFKPQKSHSCSEDNRVHMHFVKNMKLLKNWRVLIVLLVSPAIRVFLTLKLLILLYIMEVCV